MASEVGRSVLNAPGGKFFGGKSSGEKSLAGRRLQTEVVVHAAIRSRRQHNIQQT
jgi:hypothetical protein